MGKGFVHRKRVHFAPVLIVAGLNRRLQVMAGKLNRKRVCDNASRPFVVLHPGWMRHRNPYWMSVNNEFDVYGIRMAGSYGHNQCLIQAMEFMSGPAVDGVKVFVHSCKNDIGDRPEGQVTSQFLSK